MKHAAQPAQELLDATRVAIVRTQHPLEKDWQFVDHQQNAMIMLGAAPDQPLPVVSPVSSVQSSADLQAKTAHTDVLDGFGCALRDIRYTAQSRQDWTNRVGCPRDVGDHILGAGSVLYVGEQRNLSVGVREPAPEFLDDACLAHTPLAAQQHVVAVANALLQDSKLSTTVKEVVAAHPAASRRSHVPYRLRISPCSCQLYS